MNAEAAPITPKDLSYISPTSDLRDAPYGWITDIPAHIKINKGRAIKMYQLDPQDLDGIKYDDRLVEYAGYYCNDYKERDIEWIAWQIHGGPIEYWRFLKQLLKANKTFLSTLFPYSYRSGARYDLNLPAAPELQDRYVCDSIVLREAKRDLEPWIWKACNVVLDTVLLGGRIPICAKDLTAEREAAMRCAVSAFPAHHRLYAGRPDQPMTPSRSIIAFRTVLSEAPIVPEPGSPECGGLVEGLELISTEEPSRYDWDAEYLERVFTATRGVLEELGPGDAGWARARWEVYDKYSQSLALGIRYDRTGKAWSDNAVDWLEWRIPSKGLQRRLRSKCAAGREFNKLLPRSHPSSSSSSAPRPSQAGPSNVSSPRSPSSARSSE